MEQKRNTGRRRVTRRDVVGMLGGSLIASSRRVMAQQSGQVRLIGGLAAGFGTDYLAQTIVRSFEQKLQQLGWIIGQNLRVEYRWTGGEVAKFQSYAAELVRLKPDVLFTATAAGLMALRHQTSTIPIVFMNVPDPVALGFIASLARPGGNITGFAGLEFSIGPKWLQLLKEMAPEIVRVALIFDADTTPDEWFHSIETSAAAISVSVIRDPVRDDAEIGSAITKASDQPHGGLIVLPSGFTTTHRNAIIASAARTRLPAIYWNRTFVADGGLMYYGIDLAEQARQLAAYVDQILRGANPAELPVQAPTKFESVINLKTAKAIGLTVPTPLLATADDVIE